MTLLFSFDTKIALHFIYRTKETCMLSASLLERDCLYHKRAEMFATVHTSLTADMKSSFVIKTLI